MSRTIIEIPMKTNKVDEVLSIVTTTMRAANYSEKIVDGETVWAKGDGVMMKMQCVGTVFTEKSVVIQGWMKDAITGESDLEGFVAKFPKQKQKALMDDIRRQIITSGL